MSRFNIVAALGILVSVLTVPACVAVAPAMAHEGGHGGGGGGEHGGGLGDGERGGGFEGGNRGGFSGGHFTNHDGGDHPGHIAGRFRRDDYFFNSFGEDEDDCYPEWAYDRDSHPFRSDVCPD